MTAIHETESLAPEPVQPRDTEPHRQDESKPPKSPEYVPVEPDTGKILDTYA